MVFQDMLNREVNLEKTPQRIVSLVPSQTELLVYLGLEQSIVGITKFCVHPGDLKKSKTIVGGTKKVHFDRISALNPDIILCNKEENTPEMVARLEKIAPVHVSDIIDFEDALSLINSYGKIFACQEKASDLVETLKLKKKSFIQNTGRPSVKVAYFIWRNPWMVVGGDNFINSMLKLNGFINVFENKKGRYPQIDLQEIKDLKVEILFLSSEPFPFKEKHKVELDEDAQPIIIVDGEYFSWYGSRLLKAFDYFEEIQKLVSSSL